MRPWAVRIAGAPRVSPLPVPPWTPDSEAPRRLRNFVEEMLEEPGRRRAPAVQNGLYFARTLSVYHYDGTAWTLSKGYATYVRAAPCFANGAANPQSGAPVYLKLPAFKFSAPTPPGGFWYAGPLGVRHISAGAADGSIVAYHSGDGTESISGQTMNGYVTADSVPLGGDLPILHIWLKARAIQFWHETVTPDVHFGYTTGWALCDGSTVNGVATPDFRGRYLGIAGDWPAGEPGGLGLASSGPTPIKHKHTIPSTPLYFEVGDTGVNNATITEETQHLLPYYGTNAIMWVGIPGIS